MKKSITLIIVLLSVVYISSAQTVDRRWSVGIHGGFNQYSGDLGNGFYRCNHGTYGLGGLSLSRYINRFLDVSLMGNYGKVGYSQKSNFPYGVPINKFETNMFHVNLNLRLKFLANDDWKLSPFIFVGFGMSHDQSAVPDEFYYDQL